MSIMQDFEKARKTIGAKNMMQLKNILKKYVLKVLMKNIIKNLTA